MRFGSIKKMSYDYHVTQCRTGNVHVHVWLKHYFYYTHVKWMKRLSLTYFCFIRSWCIVLDSHCWYKCVGYSVVTTIPTEVACQIWCYGTQTRRELRYTLHGSTHLKYDMYVFCYMVQCIVHLQLHYFSIVHFEINISHLNCWPTTLLILEQKLYGIIIFVAWTKLTINKNLVQCDIMK